MSNPQLKAQYLELLQSAYLECMHEFGKFMDNDIYEEQIRGIRTRAWSEGIDPNAFESWVGEALHDVKQRTWRKVA